MSQKLRSVYMLTTVGGPLTDPDSSLNAKSMDSQLICEAVWAMLSCAQSQLSLDTKSEASDTSHNTQSDAWDMRSEEGCAACNVLVQPHKLRHS